MATKSLVGNSRLCGCACNPCSPTEHSGRRNSCAETGNRTPAWRPKSCFPPGYVATGFGAGIAPEWDVKRMRAWARPLLPNGTLGAEKEFRGGSDLKSGVERQVRLDAADRVLTSVGLNCGFNDVNGIKAQSARLINTATSTTQ